MCVCATVDDGQDQTIFLQLTYYVLRSSLAPVYVPTNIWYVVEVIFLRRSEKTIAYDI